MQLDLLHDEPCIPVKKPVFSREVASFMTAEMTAHTMELVPATDEKSADAFKTISEAAEVLGVPQHVLRFWEGHFRQIKPLKMRGGRRYYRPEDMEILITIKNLLYRQGYTIKGAKKALVVANVKPAEELPLEVAPAVNDTKHDTLMALRQELIQLRDTLKPHVF